MKKVKVQRSLWRVMLPYCLEQLEDGRYILLNRFYKPLGFNPKDGASVRYEDFEDCCHRIKLSKKKAKAISYDNSEDTTRVYLYNDASKPYSSSKNTKDYFSRLQILAKLNLFIFR